MIIDTICMSCDLPFPVNDLGLCEDCFNKLERDLIRSRDWEYSVKAFAVAEDQLESLRERIIREYGADYELIDAPDVKKPKRLNKRPNSRTTQRKQELAARVIREYDTDGVMQAALDYIKEQNEEWVNFSTVSQHLYERFYKLKPKRLGQPDKKYKSLLKFLQDYPTMFIIHEDNQKRGVFWIRLA